VSYPPNSDHVNAYAKDILDMMKKVGIPKHKIFFLKYAVHSRDNRTTPYFKVLVSRDVLNLAQAFWRRPRGGTWFMTESHFRTAVFFSLKALLDAHNPKRDPNQHFVIDGTTATAEEIKAIVNAADLFPRGGVGITVIRHRTTHEPGRIKLYPTPLDTVDEFRLSDLLDLLGASNARMRAAGMPGGSRVIRPMTDVEPHSTVFALKTETPAKARPLRAPGNAQQTKSRGTARAPGKEGTREEHNQRARTKQQASKSGRSVTIGDTESQHSARTTASARTHVEYPSGKADTQGNISRRITALEREITNIKEQRYKQIDVSKFEQRLEKVDGQIADLSHRVTNTRNRITTVESVQKRIEEKTSKDIREIKNSIALLLLQQDERYVDQRITRGARQQFMARDQQSKRPRPLDGTSPMSSLMNSELQGMESEFTQSTHSNVSLVARGRHEDIDYPDLFFPGRTAGDSGGGRRGIDPSQC